MYRQMFAVFHRHAQTDWYYHHLYKKEGAVYFAVRSFVSCVLSVVACLLFLLVPLVGYVL